MSICKNINLVIGRFMEKVLDIVDVVCIIVVELNCSVV